MQFVGLVSTARHQCDKQHKPKKEEYGFFFLMFRGICTESDSKHNCVQHCVNRFFSLLFIFQFLNHIAFNLTNIIYGLLRVLVGACMLIIKCIRSSKITRLF